MQTHEVVLLQFYALQHIRKAALADIHFFYKNYFIRAMTYLLKSNELNFLHGVKGSLGVRKNDTSETLPLVPFSQLIHMK